MEDREQLSLLKQVQIQNRISVKILGSKTTFEFGTILLGVQTSLENTDKFRKILICFDLPKCEFRLTWMYGEI
jgi:hypothetical protein